MTRLAVTIEGEQIRLGPGEWQMLQSLVARQAGVERLAPAIRLIDGMRAKQLLKRVAVAGAVGEVYVPTDFGRAVHRAIHQRSVTEPARAARRAARKLRLRAREST